MSNSMRELGGLVDNLYISSQQQKNRGSPTSSSSKHQHPSDLPGMMSSKNRHHQQPQQDASSSSPTRARKTKVGQSRDGEPYSYLGVNEKTTLWYH